MIISVAIPIDQRKPFSFHVAGFNTLPTAPPAVLAFCWILSIMDAFSIVIKFLRHINLKALAIEDAVSKSSFVTCYLKDTFNILSS